MKDINAGVSVAFITKFLKTNLHLWEDYGSWLHLVFQTVLVRPMLTWGQPIRISLGHDIYKHEEVIAH